MDRKKILIVGEIGTMAGELLLKLREEGYSIIGIAESGQEALNTAEHNVPDAALIDVRLKGRLNAAEVASSLMENFSPQPSIVYLTYSREDIPLHPEAEYVMMPVAINDLIRKLDSITNNKALS